MFQPAYAVLGHEAGPQQLRRDPLMQLQSAVADPGSLESGRSVHTKGVSWTACVS